MEDVTVTISEEQSEDHQIRAFGSAQKCAETCNITRLEWCDNIEIGLQGLRCFTADCISTLCKLARDCEATFEEPAEGYCPTVFDGWSCINSTLAGETAEFPCPPFDNFNYNEKNPAYRSCAQNSTWWDTVQQKPYTNYEKCPDAELFIAYDAVNKIYIAGYVVSIIFLLVATSIFFFFRRALRCVRNEIHTHLFVASILHNASWLLWYGAVIYRFDTIHNWTEDERVACIALHILIHYFMVATYMWMLAEGLYLYIVLVVTFVSEKRVKQGLYLLGWGLPFLVILAYLIARGAFSSGEENIHCWYEDLHYNWMYKLPCILSVFANLFFLCWIVFVLVSKFHADISDRASLVKTARAIALLVPLFGLHHFVAAFKPDSEGNTKFAIEVISALTISFQGMVVAILFCLINNEVLMELKKFFGQHIEPFNGQQSIAMTQYTIVRPGGGVNGTNGQSPTASSPPKTPMGVGSNGIEMVELTAKVHKNEDQQVML